MFRVEKRLHKETRAEKWVVVDSNGKIMRHPFQPGLAVFPTKDAADDAAVYWTTVFEAECA